MYQFTLRCRFLYNIIDIRLQIEGDFGLIQIVKNSLIFALVGLKRNFLALLGTVILIFLELGFIFGVGGILLSLGVALPLMLMFSTMAYMKVFAAYFKIKEIMIDPYAEESTEDDGDDDEVIMRDDVTEKQRLEEIKMRNGLQ